MKRALLVGSGYSTNSLTSDTRLAKCVDRR
jgi:hypothetical protein